MCVFESVHVPSLKQVPLGLADAAVVQVEADFYQGAGHIAQYLLVELTSRDSPVQNPEPQDLRGHKHLSHT